MTAAIKGYSTDGLVTTTEALMERIEEPGLVVIDTRPLEEYREGHLPRARHIDLFRLRLKESSDSGLGAFNQTMEHVFSDAGVTPDSTVVFYEDSSGHRAARGVFLMEYLGHPRASLLDGGLAAWKAAGGGLTTVPYEPRRGSFSATLHEELLASCQYVLNCLERDAVVLLDARRPTEHTGEEVRAARGGHIPRAVNIDWRQNLDASGAFKSAEALRALYSSHGVTPDKEIVVYCQGGYRSSNSWLALKLIGYPRVRNYLASWAEWGDRTDTPVSCPFSP